MTTTRHTLTNGTASYCFTANPKHPLVEDFDGPVVMIETADWTRFLPVDKARAMYAQLRTEGFRAA
jgi:hypothetical protein